MKRNELYKVVKEVVAEKVGAKVTNQAAREITDEIFTKIVDAVKNDGEVVLPGIGKLKLVETAPRKGKTVVNGEVKEWSKPAGKTIRLRLSSALKESL